MRRILALALMTAAAHAACVRAVEERGGVRTEVYTVREGGDLQRGPIRGVLKVVTGPQGGHGEDEFLLLPLARIIAVEVRLRDRTAIEFDLGQTGEGWRRVRVVAEDRLKSYQAILDLIKDSQP